MVFKQHFHLSLPPFHLGQLRLHKAYFLGLLSSVCLKEKFCGGKINPLRNRSVVSWRQGLGKEMRAFEDGRSVLLIEVVVIKVCCVYLVKLIELCIKMGEMCAM